jgi:glycosyltransferase involved in cell wall biosynthesis
MKTAVLVPCYNEELTIAKVVNDFKKELPDAVVYVYDNNSTDNTIKEALQAGAVVKKVKRQGKGNVVKRMFTEIDADIYILVDGDDTYPASFVHKLIEPVKNSEADVVVGDRLTNGSYFRENKRKFHSFGNNLIRFLINKLFKADLRDILSGYRVFSKKFVKNFPVESEGFEIETEITLYALDKKYELVEVPIEYKDRPEGSYSKLNTYSDGIRVVKTIFWLFKDYRPLIFFMTLSILFFVFSLMFGIPVIMEFFETHYITKVPSAILSVGLMLIAVLSVFSGLILDTIVSQNKKEYILRVMDWENENKHNHSIKNQHTTDSLIDATAKFL